MGDAVGRTVVGAGRRGGHTELHLLGPVTGGRHRLVEQHGRPRTTTAAATRRTGSQANQAMAYGPNDERVAQLASLVDVAHVYHLEHADAQRIVDEQVDVIRGAWADVCDEAPLTADQRSTFLGRQFLNPSVFEHGRNDSSRLRLSWGRRER